MALHRENVLYRVGREGKILRSSDMAGGVARAREPTKKTKKAWPVR